MDSVHLPTCFVEFVTPRAEPVPFYGQTASEAVHELLCAGWRVDSSAPVGVVFLVSPQGKIVGVWTVEAMNARTATKKYTGIDPFARPEPTTEWVRVR